MARLLFQGKRLVVEVEKDELEKINEIVTQVMFANDWLLSEVYESSEVYEIKED